MLIIVDPHSGVPVYRQLMDQIKFHIASGLLRSGDELPSTRALSSELGVNPMTISKAYSYLERDAVVERRPGRPLVVKALRAGQIRDRQLDQLRESLVPTVTMVRQLGIGKQEAVKVFGDMLADEDTQDSTVTNETDAGSRPSSISRPENQPGDEGNTRGGPRDGMYADDRGETES